MLSSRKKLSENLIPLVLASFVFMSIFGIGMGMETRDGQMSSCPFMANKTSICQMSVTEHIGQWQQAFLGMPTKASLLALVMLLLSAIIIPFAKTVSEPKNLPTLTARILTYQRANFAKIFSPLLLAFSDGILNPKIYSFTSL